MANSQPPKDLIVMTRLNTVGLKRLAEGTLVEKKPFESRPPEPVRISGGMSGKSSPPPAVSLAGLPPAPLPMSGPPTLLEDDELGPDADDRTLALGADGSEDRTVAAPVKTPPPPAFSKGPALAPPSYPPPAPVDVRLEMETPTAMFVKDIQRTLQEELSKQKQDRFEAPTAAPPALKPVSLADGDVEVDMSPSTTSSKKKAAEAKAAEKKPEPAPLAFELKYEPLPAKVTSSVPPPPTSKPSSLAPPAKQSSGALPAPLPAQASRRKDPVAVSVPARSQRVERKGGFMPWAAALTALGVFVGVAGARVATGAPFLQAVTAPAAAPAAPPVVASPASEPGFAPRVAVPAEAPAAVPAEPVKAVAAEPAPEPPVVEAKAEPKIEAKEEKREDKPLAKVEEKLSAKEVAPKEVKAKPEPRVERPRRAAPPPPAEEKVEKVAKAEKAEKVEKVEKPEPAPKPVKEPKPTKSSDVSNAAKDYANVESQIGPTL